MFDWDDQKNQVNIAKHGVSFDNFTVDRIDDRFFMMKYAISVLVELVQPQFWRSPTPTEMVFVGSYRQDQP